MSYLYNVSSVPVTGDLSLATSIPTGTGATARTFRAHFGDVIWASDFGVQANNSSNDTVAWGNALNAALGTTKYIVMAPPGISLVSNITVPTGVTVIGTAPVNSYQGGTVASLLGSVIKQTAGTKELITLSATTVGNDDRGSGLINIGVIGDGVHDGILCGVSAAVPFFFTRVHVTGCLNGINGNGSTIFCSDSQMAYNTTGILNLTDSRINNCGFNGNGIGVDLTNGMNDNTISHCKIEFNTSYGVRVDTTEDNIIIGNNFDSPGIDNLRWTNNICGVISGNTFRNQPPSNTMTGFHLNLSGNSDTTVTGNTSRMWAGGTPAPTNSVGGGANTSVIMLGNSWRGHTGSTAINGAVTGLTTTGNLT